MNDDPAFTKLDEAIKQLDIALRGIAIGSKRLLRLVFAQRQADVVTVHAGETKEIFIETLEQSQHSFYLWDVVSLDDAVVDVYITAGVVTNAVAGGVNCSLDKRRNFLSPDRIDVILIIDNAVGGDLTLSYKVYRVAGLD